MESKKAKEYLENKNALEKIEVALTAYEIETLNEKYQLAKDRINELNNEIVTLSSNSSSGYLS